MNDVVGWLKIWVKQPSLLLEKRGSKDPGPHSFMVSVIVWLISERPQWTFASQEPVVAVQPTHVSFLYYFIISYYLFRCSTEEDTFFLNSGSTYP